MNTISTEKVTAIEVPDFPDGFGLHWRPQASLAGVDFETVFKACEMKLRADIRHFGFVIVHAAAALAPTAPLFWRSHPPNLSDKPIPWHTDGKNAPIDAVFLTQPPAAIPRMPSTLIAPAHLISSVLSNERVYASGKRRALGEVLCASPDIDRVIFLDNVWDGGKGDLVDDIIKLQCECTAALASQIYAHDWREFRGSVLCIDNFYSEALGAKTLHARGLLGGQQRCTGGNLYAATLRERGDILGCRP